MRNKNMFVIFLFALIFFGSNNQANGIEGSISLPKAHFIADVPYHCQISGLSCGPAALEMLYDFWGEDIDQMAITDVARTSLIGTYTWDMVRAGFFSHLSRGQGRFFPHAAPRAGYPERPLGYVSFAYSSDTFWWPDLKALIAHDIPVVLFMKFAPDDEAYDDATAHYRVIVGYDEEEEVVYFLDPWNRDLKKETSPDGTVTWSMADFENAWNYTGYGTSLPYWGAVMMPWTVAIHTTGEKTAGSVLEVTAEITYPCPQPFDCSAYYTFNAIAEITLPPKMSLLEGTSSIDIGHLQAGESVTVTWMVKLDEDSSGSSIGVKATGLVSGAVPEINRGGEHKNVEKNKEADEDYGKKSHKICYPAYDYTDEIGVEKSIEL
ncbi:MAG: C39 family peptidase [Candidatus Brocadia sp.]|nr:MAG: C39 family peptidase [Candidatus Brocadia sp.]